MELAQCTIQITPVQSLQLEKLKRDINLPRKNLRMASRGRTTFKIHPQLPSPAHWGAPEEFFLDKLLFL